MTITERVLAYLKEQPGTPREIAEALNLTRRRGGYGNYYWGKWRFGDAEMLGLIEWKNEQWHLKEADNDG